MLKPHIESIHDIAPFAHEHLLPEIMAAAEVCIKCFWEDPSYNDMWTFGTQFWRNTWNRLRTVAELEDCPFDLYGKGNEYKIKIGPYILRHHRINERSKLPNGGKAVKQAAQHIQLSLFNDSWDVPIELDNIVLAIDVDIEKGLKEVFLGEIMPVALKAKQYRWVEKAHVYLADGTEASTTEIIHLVDMTETIKLAPVEKPVNVKIKLVHPKKKATDGERDGDI